MRFLYPRFFLALLGLLFLSRTVPAQMMTADQAFQVSSSEQPGHLQLDVQIDDCCYLYLQRWTFHASPQVHLGTAHFDPAPTTKIDPDLGKVAVFHHALHIDLPVQGQGSVDVGWQGCNERLGICYPPQHRRLPIEDNGASAAVAASAPWSHLLSFYLGGLGLALTPCVLPMIPILAGLLARGGRRRDQIIASGAYVLGSASSYAGIGALFAWLGHSLDVAAWFASPFWHVSLAVIFIGLALSLFDVYHLHLPAALHQRLDGWSRRQQAGSVIGAYVMGVLAALIVSPCVSAPMAGALIYVTDLGQPFWGGLLLFTLGLGLGTPILLLGFGESRLLPRAGPWMHAVRIVFGVGMLIVALQLLQPLLPALYLLLAYALLAIACGSALGAFEGAAAGWPRLWKAVGLFLSLIGIVWVIGAFAGGRDLTHPWPQQAPARRTPGASMISVQTPAALQQALQAARGQRVMLDVWASWCLSCRHFEEDVLAQNDVQMALQGIQVIRVDVSAAGADSDALLQELHIPGPPALFFYDTQGQAQGDALFGEVSHTAFLQRLQTWR